MAKITPATVVKPAYIHTIRVRKRSWLSARTVEIGLSRPDAFSFVAGQRIRFIGRSNAKDYSLISTPQDPSLTLCVREVKGGGFSSRLAHADILIPRLTSPAPTISTCAGAAT